MTIQPIFYDNTKENVIQDTLWLDSLGGLLSNTIASLATSGVPNQIIGLTVGLVSGTQASYITDQLSMNINKTDDPMRIKIDVNGSFGIYNIDTITDIALGLSATQLLISVLGISPTGILAISIATGIGTLYSKFVDPITDEILLTLDGKDEVQLLDANGNVVAGMIYPDGVGVDGAAQRLAVHETLFKASQEGFNPLSLSAKIHTSLVAATDYDVQDNALFADIAVRAELGSVDALVGIADNIEYYGLGDDGTEYVISSVEYVEDQLLTIPVDAYGDGNLSYNAVRAVFDGLHLGWGSDISALGGNAANAFLMQGFSALYTGVTVGNAMIFGNEQNNV